MYRFVGLVLAATSAASGSALACADPLTIEEAADRFDALQQAQDRPGLEAMVAPDLTYINGRGELRSRADFFAATMAPVESLAPFVISERRIIDLGRDGAAVSGLGVVTGVAVDGSAFSATIRFMDLFACIDDRWSVVAVQVTPTTADEVNP